MSEKRPSVYDRIVAGAATKDIDVTPRELRAEIAKLAKEGNETGLMDIYEAMLDFERDGIEGESAAELSFRVKDNLDMMANAADQESMGARRADALAMAADNVNDIGNITKFYRKVVNFVPRVDE
jgi:hypothetical protein